MKEPASSLRFFQENMMEYIKNQISNRFSKEDLETAEEISKSFPDAKIVVAELLIDTLNSRDKSVSLKEIGDIIRAEPVRSFILKFKDRSLVSWSVFKAAEHGGFEGALETIKVLEQFATKPKILNYLSELLCDVAKKDHARCVTQLAKALGNARIREFASNSESSILCIAMYAGLQNALDIMELYEELKFGPALSNHFIRAIQDLAKDGGAARVKKAILTSSGRQIKDIVMELRKYGYGHWGFMGYLIGQLTIVTGYAGRESSDIVLQLLKKFRNEKKISNAIGNTCAAIARYDETRGIKRLADAMSNEQFKRLMSEVAEEGHESENDLAAIAGYWGKKGIAYCIELSNKCGAEKEPFDKMLIGIKIDSERHPDLVRAALKTVDSGGAEPETYRRVRYLFEHGSRDCTKLFASKELLDQRINTVLKSSGLKYKLLAEAEKVNLLFNLDENGVLDENANYINEFLARREEQSEFSIRINGFNLKPVNADKVFGLIPLNGDVSQKRVNPNELVKCLVLACEAPDAQVRLAARRKLKDIFGAEHVDKAVGSWQRIKGEAGSEEKAELYDVFKKVKSSPAKGAAGEVLSIFKKLARSHGLKDNEALSDIVNALEGARLEPTITIGDTITAFTVKNKDNAFLIKSSHTGCCAFLGGGNDWAVLRYAADPAIVMVQFAFANGHKTVEQLKQNVRGVGVCCPAVTADNKKIFLVDSVEGGIRFGEAVRYRIQPLVETFISVAKNVGAEEVAFYTKPAGSIPKTILRSLVRHLGAGKREVELKGVCRQDHYLESGVSNAEFRPVPVISVPVKSRA